eukprot:jgi/Ulvmu1/3741/UM173_0014.1
MDSDIGEQVYIGCIDIVGCGACVVNAINAPSSKLKVGLDTPPPVELAVSPTTGDKNPTLSPFTVKHCTSDSGQLASFIGINATGSDECLAIKAAHAVVSILRNAPAVKQVTLIGASHLPMCPSTTMAVCSANGAQVPAALQSCKIVPVEAMLKNEMIASLYYWLCACGIPTIIFLAPANRPAAGTGAQARNVDAAACAAVAKVLKNVVKVEVDPAVIDRTILIGSVPIPGPRVDSLMYM